jgi:hypothetical protein
LTGQSSTEDLVQRKPGLNCLLWKSCGPKQRHFVYAHFRPLPLVQNESSPSHLLCQLPATHPYTLSHSQPIHCNPENESSMSLWNTGIDQYDYTTSQYRRVKTVSEGSQENKQLPNFTLNKTTVHCVSDRCYKTNSYIQIFQVLKKIYNLCIDNIPHSNAAPFTQYL